MVLRFRQVCYEICFIVKLPAVALHPLPASDHVPVIEPPESVVVLAVPVTVPLRVRVSLADCTL